MGQGFGNAGAFRVFGPTRPGAWLRMLGSARVVPNHSPCYVIGSLTIGLCYLFRMYHTGPGRLTPVFPASTACVVSPCGVLRLHVILGGPHMRSGLRVNHSAGVGAGAGAVAVGFGCRGLRRRFGPFRFAAV